MSGFRFRPVVLLYILIAGSPSANSAAPDIPAQTVETHSYKRAPDPDTPVELQKIWLRFHEDNLCQQIEAVFLFHEKKMEVWTVFEDTKNYMKLVKLLQPLQTSYQITLHKILPEAGKNIPDIRTPPPGLRENSKLYGYYLDYILPPLVSADPRQPSYSSNLPSYRVYKRRLVMLARNILEYAGRIKKYSADLLPLAQVALDPAAKSELKHRARAICLKHIQELQKYEKKLSDNLSKALPKPPETAPPADLTGKPATAKGSPLDIAARMAGETDGLFKEVYQFLFPTNHTVSVRDLKNPPLMLSLETIRKMTAQFCTDISESGTV